MLSAAPLPHCAQEIPFLLRNPGDQPASTYHHITLCPMPLGAMNRAPTNHNPTDSYPPYALCSGEAG